MRKNQLLRNLLATTFICGSVGIATPAFAQDTGPVEGADPATSADGAQDEGASIVVTGSRIRQPNLTSVSPVTVVNSQEVRMTGTTRAEDLVNSLPQAFAGQGSTIANGASGTATLDLRDLGPERTLVLINGRRLVPGDPTSAAADINVIPAALIDRVDILTGGASSVYGSDAISGVVNFIMDTDFEGVRLDSQYSFYQHNNRADGTVTEALDARGFGYPTGNVADGGTWDVNLAIGAGFDDGRGHVMIYAGYRKADAVTQGRRDYSSCALTARTPAQVTAFPGAGSGTAGSQLAFCGGSATSANGSVVINVPRTPTAGNPNVFTSTFFQVGPNRTLIGGFTPYNFAPTNYYQRPDERYTLGGFAEYEISPALRPYLEVMFMNDRTVAQIAPSGNFGNTFSLNCDNPLLSAQQRSLICAPGNLLVDPDGSTVASDSNALAAANRLNSDADPTNNVPVPVVRAPFVFLDPVTGTPYNRGFAQILRRNVEGGGRRDDLQHTNYRIVAGMRGDLNSAWSYDFYYQFAQTNFAETYSNDFSIVRLGRALDVIDNPATVGVDPICRSAQSGGDDPNCVPWDIFATGGVSAGSLNYLQTPGFQRGTNQQTVANASITGNLGGWGMQFPWAENGIGIALGVEYRRDTLELLTDIAFQTGDLAGQGAATLPVSGEFDVREAFTEIRIPIVEDNFFHSLALEGGFRYSDYDLGARSVSTETYKAAVDFAPIRDVRFRAAYNRAVRAPNIQELFAPQRVVLNGSSDPCAGFTITAADQGCLLQGLSVGQTVAENPAAQYNGLIGGNPNLDPEVADTITIGIVLQPRFLPRFALTVDWFNIEIADAVQPVGQDTILNTCVNTLDPTFCGLIQRDQFGSLWRTNNGFVRDLSINVGSFKTRGVDIQASYSMELGGMGGLGFSFVGTWLDRLTTDNGVSEPYNCVGLYGNQCLVPTPEWRHTARVSWTHPDGYGLSVRWRYFSSVDQDSTSTNATLAGASQELHRTLGAQSYFDLTSTFRIGDHYAFRLGVNNLLDRDPPLVGAQACPPGPCNGNTWSQVYDALGRYIFAGVTLDF